MVIYNPTQKRISNTSCCRGVIVLLSGKASATALSQTPQKPPRRGRYRAHRTHSFFHTPNTLTPIILLKYRLLFTLSATLLLKPQVLRQSRSGLMIQYMYIYIYTTKSINWDRPALIPSPETPPSPHSSSMTTFYMMSPRMEWPRSGQKDTNGKVRVSRDG